MDDITNVSEIKWELGEKCAKVISALAKQRRCSKTCILKAVAILKISEWQIYRLIKKYRLSQGLLTSLIPKKPNGGKGKVRLSQEQEKVIQKTIEEHSLPGRCFLM